MTQHRVSRRAFLTGTTAAGLTLAAARGRPAEAADPKVLRVRSYVNLETLDPAFRLSAPEGDIIDAILLGLVGLKPGETWGWERDAALSIEQVDPTHIKFQLQPGIRWTERLRRGHRRGREILLRAHRRSRHQGRLPRRLGEARPGRGHGDPHAASSSLKRAVHAAVDVDAADRLGPDRLQESGARRLRWPALHAGPGADLRALPDQKCEPRAAVTLERNPLWPGAKPPFDEIQYIAILDANAAEIAYEAGEIDVTHAADRPRCRASQKMPPRTRS